MKKHLWWIKHIAGVYWIIHPRTFQMSRKTLLFLRLNFTRWQAKNQRRINSRTFKIKTPSIFYFFQFHIRQYTTKNNISLNSQLQYYSTKPRINLFQKIRKKYRMGNNYHTRWLSTIHEDDPRSWRWWYHGNDSTRKLWWKNLNHVNAWYVLNLIVGVLWYM